MVDPILGTGGRVEARVNHERPGAGAWRPVDDDVLLARASGGYLLVEKVGAIGLLRELVVMFVDLGGRDERYERQCQRMTRAPASELEVVLTTVLGPTALLGPCSALDRGSGGSLLIQALVWTGGLAFDPPDDDLAEGHPGHLD